MFAKIKGVTLLELIMALAVASMVLGMIISMNIILQKVWQNQFEKYQINQKFMLITERIIAQVPGVSNLNQLDLSNVPYGEDLHLDKVSGLPQIFSVSLTKEINRNKYYYFAYYKFGAY